MSSKMGWLLGGDLANVANVSLIYFVSLAPSFALLYHSLYVCVLGCYISNEHSQAHIPTTHLSIY